MPDHLRTIRTVCPECGAQNLPAAHWCVACGRDLGVLDAVFARATGGPAHWLQQTREEAAAIKAHEEAASQARLAEMWAIEQHRREELAQAQAERDRQMRVLWRAVVILFCRRRDHRHSHSAGPDPVSLFLLMTALSRRLIPLWLFVAFLAVYGLTAGVSLERHSLAPHFVYLAEALLHGRLDLIHIPDPPYDLTPFAGHWYVSFPPLPALLMLPLVALRGLAVSDIAFSVVMGALDVALLWLVLQRLGIGDRGLGIGLCVLLGLGTPLWYCAALGSVWYTAHVVAVGCLCLYALEVLGRNRPLVAGLWLGLGFLARAPVLLAFPLSLVLGFQQRRGFWKRMRFLLLLALGMMPALMGQAAYNWARFGNPLEFGYRWMNSPGALAERRATWGQFSLHFLPENLYTLLVRPPLISLAPFRITPDPWGMGLLWTCPALVMIALTLFPLCPPPPLPTLGEGEGGRGVGVRAGLWLSIALVQIPLLLYFNTGSYQFGYRFALDWLPLGVLLAALGTGGRLRGWGKALIAVSVLMHLWGVLWMYPNFNGQPWHLQYIELPGRLLH